jgi:serine/threonine protein kinase
MAPEQAHGDALGHRADLFSLGSVLYTMASGRPPFRANSTLAVLKRVAEDTRRPIPEIIPEVPEWLCDLIARLHAKKPAERIGTAQEVADLLGRGLEALQRMASYPPPPDDRAPAGTVEQPKPAPAVKPSSRARFGAVAAAVFLTLLGGLGITDATGVTNVRGTVIRLFSPEGTLEMQVDDPSKAAGECQPPGRRPCPAPARQA